MKQYREPMKSIAPFRAVQTPVNANVNRMVSRSMIHVPRMQIQHASPSDTTPTAQIHERRQAFLFRNTPNLTSSSSSFSTIPATSSSNESVFGGLENVSRPPNKFMRFVHERIAPRWQQFQPRAVQFLKRHKRNIGIGLGVIGGTAIVGGTLGGILGKDDTQNYSEPSLKQMPLGSTIYSGGGGGGGSLLPYSGLMRQQYIRRTHKQKRKSVKNIKRRKRLSKNYLKLKSLKKFKRKPKRRVKKRITFCKKSKSKKFPAF